MIRHTTVIFLFFPLLFSACKFQQEGAGISDDLKLWYDEPAEFFEQCLVLGNGKMGASVFGGVAKDSIFLNDATLWSGEPVDPNMNPEAYKHVPAIREALKNEDYELADKLNRKLQGSFSQSFAPLGTVLIEYGHSSDTADYYRELDISNAISKVQYKIDSKAYQREYLISHPDQVMAIKLTSADDAGFNFRIRFRSLLRFASKNEGNVLEISGYAPYHAEPNYRGDMPDAVRFDDNKGIHFTTLFTIDSRDGQITGTDSTLTVSEASEAIIYISIATSFNGFDKDPVEEGLNHRSIAHDKINAAVSKSYGSIRKAHIEDYKSYFDRVSIKLEGESSEDLPTDDRLRKYSAGETDKGLEALYFQFGRYLLISSSRTPGVPANLQGIWNPYLRPPWSSNYTANINVEENYWLAESGNLTEMHQPLLSFIRNLSETGVITAKTFYGVNGWASCHNTDIWAMSNPVGDFGKGHPVWANWNMSGAWLSTHLWEHYLYTQDETFLRDNYPIIKGASLFCLEWLVEDKRGFLITSPSTSPENLYLTPGGYRGATLYGATADLAMIRELFALNIEAAGILGIDKKYVKKLEEVLTRLYPYQIGAKGNLQEWYYDWEDADPKHRHQTHLFGLHPGSHITPQETPDLADASRTSLEIKGDETTGWSKGWRINLWARLLDGDRAYKMYRELLTYVEPDGVKTTYDRGGGTYPNLFDAHPPFQIDGNFGGAAGVIEMLMQSHLDVIDILPALPSDWPSGAVSGLKARGGFEVSFSWKENALIELKIKSTAAKKCKVRYKGKTVEFSTREDQVYRFDGNLDEK